VNNTPNVRAISRLTPPTSSEDIEYLAIIIIIIIIAAALPPIEIDATNHVVPNWRPENKGNQSSPGRPIHMLAAQT